MITSVCGLRVSLRRDGIEIEAFAAQSGEGAVEFAVEMLRRLKCLQPNDLFIVESMSEFVEQRRILPGTLRITVPPGSVK